MKQPEAYKQADLTIKRLNKQILAILDKTKRKLNISGFDELNVVNAIDAMYEQIADVCKKEFRKLYAERYTELWLWMKDRKPDEDTVDELVELYLANLWDEPNPNTHYAFGTELIRKRDRAKEAIISVPTKIQKQLEMDNAVRYALQQIAWYTDFTSQDAEIQALKDAGVKKVQRHEMKDDRVCAVCRKEDGKIYRIDAIPDLPHLRCRRWFSIVK